MTGVGDQEIWFVFEILRINPGELVYVFFFQFKHKSLFLIGTCSTV